MLRFRIVKARSKSEGGCTLSEQKRKAWSLLVAVLHRSGRPFPHGNLSQFGPALLHFAQRFFPRSKSRCCWSCASRIMP